MNADQVTGDESTIVWKLPQREVGGGEFLLQSAAQASGATSITVHDKVEAPADGSYNVYNVSAKTGALTLPAYADGLVLKGDNDVDVTIKATTGLHYFAGNSADDSFTVTLASTADVQAADLFVLGPGHNTVTATGTGGVLVATPFNTTNTLVLGGEVEAQFFGGRGAFDVTISDDATINTSGVSAVVHASGHATVIGGEQDLIVYGSQNTDDSLLLEAGSGHEQLYGSAGATRFITFDAGAIDLYSGAHYNAAATAQTTDIFEFYNNHATGGITRIWGYTGGQDEILMNGYTAHDLKIGYTADGDTVIKLASDNSRLAVVEGVHLTMNDLVFG